MALDRISVALLGAILLAVPALAQEATPAAPAAPAAAPETPAPPPAPAPPANTGRVYISYPVLSKATYDANVAIDEAWLADPIKSGSCVYFDLPVGDHKLHTTTTPAWHVTLAAGDTKYAELQYRGGGINGLVPADGSAPTNPAACIQGNSPI